ncbi:hypothetical protein L6452_17217 [Arctium lappa]|uniref:Uncharacterized protein n=1 Tax=Arctium lappa TaxID=4217 RepID=A0ACB9C2S2_ARCLA|nr:hypothetical protein L6452_17217 [Arctium lappa]
MELESRKLELENLDFCQETEFMSMERSKKKKLEQAFDSSGSRPCPIQVIQLKIMTANISSFSEILLNTLLVQVYTGLCTKDAERARERVELFLESPHRPTTIDQEDKQCKVKKEAEGRTETVEEKKAWN